ncbi:MAG: adenylyl-sulfate kinase [Actinomycetia bacterium]|nr:adenylyl-sulfate kinase [Actinomycetes bacterium]MCP3913229.1 adenylyl-sulfate kinase [Actinomycetes bacterium]MCP4086897.1 adenylyl-sulfate kinase [Actinomycetes bacterium]
MTDAEASSNVQWQVGTLTADQRAAHLGHRGATVWFTGLSGSGKSTVALEVERQLLAAGRPAYLLDGDNVRHGLNGDLGFSDTDRDENVRRLGEVARLMADAGVVVLVPAISPFRASRAQARAAHEVASLPFAEVHLDVPIEICEDRDPKGLYAKARAGEIKQFTGIDSPYEAPENPELRLTAGGEVADAARQVITLLV